MANRFEKAALFDAFASVGGALASGRRVELLDLLAQGERSVEVAAEAIGQTVANTSQHLKVLAGVGLLSSRRSGNRIYYRLASTDVEVLWEALRNVAATRVANFDNLATSYLGPDTPVMDRDVLASRLDDKKLVVWDVRPYDEYRQGHIRNALSVPVDSLGAGMANLRRNIAVVAYCRGPYCAFADEAVRKLSKDGTRAWRLQDGFPEWRRAGLPVSVLQESESFN